MDEEKKKKKKKDKQSEKEKKKHPLQENDKKIGRSDADAAAVSVLCFLWIR